jgi:hypothetical protein
VDLQEIPGKTRGMGLEVVRGERAFEGLDLSG